MEKEMDWYYCDNSQGSCEGYVNCGETPDSDEGDNVCNCGRSHVWIFKGTYITDFSRYPRSSFEIQ